MLLISCDSRKQLVEPSSQIPALMGKRVWGRGKQHVLGLTLVIGSADAGLAQLSLFHTLPDSTHLVQANT